jgi:hypothetical protein
VPIPVQGGTNDNPGSATTIAVTLGSAVGAGNTVCGVFSCNSASTVTIADDKGNSYPLQDNSVDGGVSQRVATFILQNITNGPQTITATASITTNFLALAVQEYSGVGVPIDGHTTNTQDSLAAGTDAVTSGLLTTTKSGDLIVGLTVSVNLGVVCTAGTGFTIRQSRSSSGANVGIFIEDQIQAAAGSIAATFTNAGTDNFITGIIAIPAAVSAVTINRSLPFESLSLSLQVIESDAMPFEFLHKVIESGSLLDFSSDFNVDFTGSGGVSLPLDFTAIDRIDANAGSIDLILSGIRNYSLLTDLRGVVSITQNGIVPFDIVQSFRRDKLLLEEFISGESSINVFLLEWPNSQQQNMSVYGEGELTQQRGDEATLSEWFSANKTDVQYPYDMLSGQYNINSLLVSVAVGQRRDIGFPVSVVASQNRDIALSDSVTCGQLQDYISLVDFNGAVVVTFNDLLPTEILKASRADASIINELLLIQRQDSSIFASLIASLRQDLALPFDFSSGLLSDWEVLGEWRGAVNIASNANIPIEFFSLSRVDITNIIEAAITIDRDDCLLQSEVIAASVKIAQSLIDTISSLVIDRPAVVAEAIAALLIDEGFQPEFMMTAFCDNGLIGELIAGRQKDAIISPEWLAQTAGFEFFLVDWTQQVGVPLVSDSGLPTEWMAVPEFLLTSPFGLLIEWILRPVPGPGQVIKTGGDKVLIVSSDLLPKG